MLPIFDGLRDITLASITLRMLLSVLCGGLIGIERAYKRRPAGFRTHILICLGASMTTMTSQFLYLNLHYYTDMARLGAQVVAGIGFIGAGTIIVTRRQRVKGLTTAAGLWTAAIIGLALGGGFYEGGICATVLVLVAEIIFSRIEYRILDHVPEINLYMEYSDKTCLERVLQLFRHHNLTIMDIEITRASGSESHNACAIFSLRLHRKCPINTLLNWVSATEGVITVAEL
ncbi:MgtC/SapB family protein [Agathobaculum sp. Marseille-P7918]|uniref:MgtC/SapB family protein n=1 Tax=Agathobaculum sp. Marseille-P7918 TaxID=2479843 RepID=UPI00356415AB